MTKKIAPAGGRETWERGLTSPQDVGVDGLPAGWVSIRLGALFEFCYGKALSAGERNASGRVPVYGSSGITGYHDIAWVNRPCIIVGRKGAAGKVILTTEPCWPIDTTYFVTPQEGLDLKFFFYLFTNLRLEKLEKSTAIPSLSRDDAYEQTIPLPPLNEQKRIVAKIEELFSELDAGEENLRLARKQLGVYRQSLLKQAFEGRLTEGWRKKKGKKEEPVEEVLKRIPSPSQPRGGRQASIQVIEGVAGLAVNRPSKPSPVGWLWTPLLRIARQETGHTPSRNHPEYWGGKFDWLGITDARKHHGGIISGTTQKITQAGLDNSSARTLPAGTVCLSRTASVGYVCIMGKDMATSQDFVTWTCTEALTPEFLMYALLAEGDEIRRFGKGTTHTTIYFPEIRALHIALPPVAEQREIVRLLTEQFEAIEQNECEIDAALARSSALRQSILKQAFAGKLQILSNPSEAQNEN